MKRIAAVTLLLCLLLSLCACGQKAPTWQEQYDLGARYLTDGNYEEAIIAFEAAIKIDPKQVEAYKSLSEAYTAVGNLEEAIKALQDGISATGDLTLQSALDVLQKQEEPEVIETPPRESGPIELQEPVEMTPEPVRETAAETSTVVGNGAMTLCSKDSTKGILCAYHAESIGENRMIQGREIAADDVLEEDEYIIFGVTGIANGYQIKSVILKKENGAEVDFTDGFVNGVYGNFGTALKKGTWTLTMEKA